MHKLSRSTIVLACLVYALYVIFMPHAGESYDTGTWAQWAAYIFEHGLGSVYDCWTNYLPGHLLELKLYTLLFSSKASVIDHIYYLKYFTLLFDVTGALLVCSLVGESSRQVLILLLFMLNPAYIHNTVFWGQFDSVFSTLCFASFLAAYRRKFLLASVIYMLSLNFKLQAIIFLPALFLFMLYQAELKINWKKLILGILIVMVMQGIILIPFRHQLGGNGILRTLHDLGGAFGQVSMNAANIWHWLLGEGNLRWTSDKIEFMGISLKRWGLVMTGTGFFIALFPLMKAIINTWRGKITKLSLLQLATMFGLTAIIFFFFNTQMHERYSFPAFLFVAAVAVLTKRWWLYGIFSAAYFLNNELCLKSFKKFNYGNWIFDFRFSAGLFMLTILILIYCLYEQEIKKIFSGKAIL
jgi:Gpi18-like mannosyltransferase